MVGSGKAYLMSSRMARYGTGSEFFGKVQQHFSDWDLTAGQRQTSLLAGEAACAVSACYNPAGPVS